MKAALLSIKSILIVLFILVSLFSFSIADAAVGDFLYEFGSGYLVDPWGIAIDEQSGNFYVTDIGNGKLWVFKNGTPPTSWEGFSLPTGIAVHPDGNVYVGDVDYPIQILDNQGNLLCEVYSSDLLCDYGYPVSMAIDGSGNIYMSDVTTTPNQVVVWKTNSCGGNGWEGQCLGTFNPGTYKNYGPHGIAIALDAIGNIYVTDTNYDSVQVFNSEGVHTGIWGGSGTADGKFFIPMGIAIDKNGHIYVADTGNNRVQVFDSNRNFLTKWGGHGSGNGRFNFPRAIAVDRSGRVYVVDAGNKRIQVFEGYGYGVPDDTTPPSTTASVSPLPSACGWNNTDVTVTLFAEDNEGGSGVQEIHYQVNGGSEVIVSSHTADVLITAQGTTILTYRAVDNSANTEQPANTLTIKIAKTPESVINNMIAVVTGLPNVNDGIKNALTSKLQNALASLARGNGTAAKNQLGAFINQVEAQRGKKLSAEVADCLIEQARIAQSLIK
jgi:sugar lactone lactonase YvrE